MNRASKPTYFMQHPLYVSFPTGVPWGAHLFVSRGSWLGAAWRSSAYSGCHTNIFLFYVFLCHEKGWEVLQIVWGCKYESAPGIQTFQTAQLKALELSSSAMKKNKSVSIPINFNFPVLLFDKLSLKTLVKRTKCSVLPQQECYSGELNTLTPKASVYIPCSSIFCNLS